MEWNGRQYRPAGQLSRSRKPDIQDMMRPYGQKQNNGNVWVPVLSIPGNVPQETSPTPPFDPSTLGGLAVWFDASDSNTLSVTSGRVDSWTSKGSVTYTLTASTSDRRPYFITTGGTGSNDAVLCLSSATASLRNILVSDVQAFSTTDGYTYFVAGKNAGTKNSIGTWSNPTPFSLHNNSSTNSYGSRLLQTSPESFTDYLTTGATAGFIYLPGLNGQSSKLRDQSAYSVIGASMDYINIPPTTLSASTSLSNGKFRYQSSPVAPSTFSGKTWNKFTLNGLSYSTESPSNVNFEYYEILVYNKTLTESEVNQVVSYLNTKWSVPSFDFSGMAVINLDNWIGKTGGTSNNLSITDISASQVLWNSFFGDFDNNILATGDTRFSTSSVSPVGYDWILLDSNNNVVYNQTCQDSTTGNIDITLSAGTYTLSGETKYTCIAPSPTPTPTETVTPTPSITPTETVTPTPTETLTPTPTPSSTPPSTASIVYSGGSSSTSNTSSYTFSNQPTGTGLVVVVIAGAVGSGSAVSSVTIGGQTATFIQNTTQTGSLGGNVYQGMVYAVTTASTNNIVVNFSSSVQNCQITYWLITNYNSSTPVYSGVTTSNNSSGLSLTTSSLNGTNVGVFGSILGGSNITQTWTNATERYDGTIEVGAPSVSGADFTTSSSGTRAVSTSHSSNGYGEILIGAVWK